MWRIILGVVAGVLMLFSSASIAAGKADSYKAESDAMQGAGGSWSYDADTDKMTGKSTKSATLTAENAFNFPFPYAGESYGHLQIRHRPSDGLSVMYSVTKGQIVCLPSCSVAVRFDSKPPMRFNAGMPASYSTDTIFLSPEPKFLAELKKSKRVLIEANFYSAGSKISEFNTTGFKWENK